MSDSSGFEQRKAHVSILFYASSFCNLIFKANPDGIFKVAFRKGLTVDRGYDFSNLKSCLDRYFSGKSVVFTEPLVYNSSGFSGAVLTALRRVPAGQTISYGGLAALAGFKGASRAVGTVMAGNPLPFLIPCHRVILASGEIGNFGSGKALKERLLRLEGAL